MASTTTFSLKDVIGDLHSICEKAAASAQNPSDQMRALLSGEANDGIDLIPFYLKTFLPAFTSARESIVSKSAAEAKKNKKQAEKYLSLVGIKSSASSSSTSSASKDTLSITEKDDVDDDEEEEESVHPDQKNIIKQAFSYVNRALRWAPPTDQHLLQELYSLRSKLHYSLGDYSLALADIDRALKLRHANNSTSSTSSWCTERKVDLLKRLDRSRDAYLFVKAELEKKVAKMGKNCYSQRKANSQQQLEVKKLRQWKAQLKAYKPKTGEAVVVADLNTAVSSTKPSVLIELHPSVTLYRDHFTHRLGVKAMQPLGTFETIICEQPTLTVLESASGAHLIYCAYCFLDCTNTFLPCPGCQDVVYCSESCASMDAQQDHPKCECSGVRGLLNAYLPSPALHSYRLLTRLNLANEQEMLSGDKKGVFSKEPLKKQFTAKKMTELLKSGSGDGNSEHSREQVQQLFAQTQVELRRRLLEKIESQSVPFSGAQLANALLQWLFYVAVKGAADQSVEKCLKEEEMKGGKSETYVRLLMHFAAEQKKVVLTQFGWHSEGDGEDAVAADDGISVSSSGSSSSTIKHGNFQCLLGSLIGPGCAPNAQWTYDSSIQRFYIRTLRPVSKDEPISIPFLDLNDVPFFQRQALINEHFYISCPCSLCFSQSAHHFALRCTACNGPVPYDGRRLPEGRCLRCSEKLKTKNQNELSAEAVLADLCVISSTVGLLEGVGGASSVITKEQIRYLETKLSKLTMQVDLHNRQLQKCIIGLSDEYIRQEKYFAAIAWYQWFVDTVGVHLAEVEEGVEDPFVSFNVLSKWVDAYIGFIEHSMEPDEEEEEEDANENAELTVQSSGKKRKKNCSSLIKIRSCHLSVGKYLFKRLFTLLGQLNADQEEHDEAVIGREQYEVLIDAMKQSAKKQYSHFKSLSRKVRRRSRTTKSSLSPLSDCSTSEQTSILSNPPEESRSSDDSRV